MPISVGVGVAVKYTPILPLNFSLLLIDGYAIELNGYIITI